MITVIVLAAGESQRMGAQKVLLPYGGRSVIEHIVCSLQEGGADEIIVVTGHDGDRVASVLEDVGVDIAFNEDYLTGMLSSVRYGIRAASIQTRAFLIVLGDQPSIRSDVVRELIAEFETHETRSGTIVVPTHNGRRGHPILFSYRFREDVLTRFDDVGLRGLLATYPDRIREIPMSRSEILRDMDYPADYANELEALENNGCNPPDS